MDIKIIPGRKLSGDIPAISSKSDVHRLLISAALSGEKTTVNLNVISNDIKSTVNCLEALGCKTEIDSGAVTVYPMEKTKYLPILDCGESGSTLRFLLPVAMILYKNVTFTGRGNLPSRPLQALTAQMEQHGCKFSGSSIPFTVYGGLSGGVFNIEGNISSQFISGLLFALPLLNCNSEIKLQSRLESSGYIDMTIGVLEKFGIQIERNENSFYIGGGQKYTAQSEVTAENDWSNAAFWFAANAIGGNINITGLDGSTLQKDKEIIRILKIFEENEYREIDASDIPDLIPVLSTVAAAKEGITKIYNISRLRMKESDRVASVMEMLTALGGDIKLINEEMIIKGQEYLNGGIVNSYNDHRIAMAAAIASCACRNKVVVTGAQAVEKSYPHFFDDFVSLEGEIEREGNL